MEPNKVNTTSTAIGNVFQLLFALGMVLGIVYLAAIYGHLLYKAVEFGWSVI